MCLYFILLGLHCCEGFSVLVISGAYSLVAGHELLIAVASLVADHGLQGVQASVAAACGLSGCSSQTLEQGLNSCGTQA